MEDLAKLVDAIAKLIGAVIWPSLLIFVLVRGKVEIAAFIETLTEFTFKFPGGETSFRRKQAEATAALVAASVARAETNLTPDAAADEARAATEAVRSITPSAVRRASRSKVLWVDDRPRNNVREQQALEAFGIEFTTATSTEQAMQILGSQKFDAVISDMGRPPDGRAGYTLLKAMRDAGIKTPFIIYAGSRAPEHVQESRKNGALGCTNRPDELFEYVLDAIGQSR